MRKILMVLVLALLCAGAALSSATASARLNTSALTTLVNSLSFPATAPRDLPFVDSPQRDKAPVTPSRCVRAGTVNPFDVPIMSVDVIVGDAINVGRGSNVGCVTPQNEPAIAVNPRNPSNIVMASNDYRMCCDGRLHNDGGGMAYSSMDSGRSFKQVLAPGLTSTTGGTGPFALVDSAGDPSLAYGPDGTLYYTNIAFARKTSVNGLGISVSHDGGRSFTRPQAVVFTDNPRLFIDKEWVTVGPGGTIYVTFTVFVSDELGQYIGSPILLATSKDARNWKVSAVSDKQHPYNQGSIPQVAPDGRLFVAFEGANSTVTRDVQLIATRGRGGFRNREIARVFDEVKCYPANSDQRSVLSGENFRINSLPAFSIDPITGRQVLVWADNPSCTTSPTHNAVQVVFGNGKGTHYSHPFSLDGGTDKAVPAVAAYGGKVVVGYYTRAYATDGESLDYAVTFLSSGFTSERRLTEQSSNPWGQFDGAFIGDYTALAFGSDGVWHAGWTDFRGNPALPGVMGAPNQDIYTARGGEWLGVS